MASWTRTFCAPAAVAYWSARSTLCPRTKAARKPAMALSPEPVALTTRST